MLRSLLLVVFLTSILGNLFSQGKIGLSTGLNIDLNNHGKYKQMPVSVQWIPARSNRSSLIFKADFSIPFGGKGFDSAYTLASGLAPAIAVEKTIRNRSLSFMVGYRFLIKTNEDNNHFFIDFLPAGISLQSFNVVYRNYNKADYKIINADIGLDKEGFIAAIGMGYTRKNLVMQLHFHTPVLALKNDDYGVSYKSGAPLQLSIGYLFRFSKIKK